MQLCQRDEEVIVIFKRRKRKDIFFFFFFIKGNCSFGCGFDGTSQWRGRKIGQTLRYTCRRSDLSEIKGKSRTI